ncbi:MAG: YcgN family cysteine cluster protein [Rhizobiaceae bacterium]|nr:YcgN family cysteine cluster protein [Rhizobiaceae bacterium]
MQSSTAKKFWQYKSLSQMTNEEWESLCDGCARCCLNKLEDWDTGEIYWTNVACELLDHDTCRCKDYSNRQSIVPDCIQLTKSNVPKLTWLPPTCAYRLIEEGSDLPDWHPLVCGNAESVHQAGISVRGRVIAEEDMKAEELENHVVEWPREII